MPHPLLHINDLFIVFKEIIYFNLFDNVITSVVTDISPERMTVVQPKTRIQGVLERARYS